MAQQPYQVRVTDKANAAARHVIECGLSQYNRAALSSRLRSMAACVDHVMIPEEGRS